MSQASAYSRILAPSCWSEWSGQPSGGRAIVDLGAASAKRNGPDLIGLELRNKKAVLTFDRNCELLDCGRVRFSLAAGLDSPHVLNPPASDDVYGPANSHGRSVITLRSPRTGVLANIDRLSVVNIRRGPPPRPRRRAICWWSKNFSVGLSIGTAAVRPHDRSCEYSFTPLRRPCANQAGTPSQEAPVNLGRSQRDK